MFRKIFLLTVISLLFIVSTASAQVYEDHNNGYSLEVPENWKISKATSNGISIQKDNQGAVVLIFLPRYPSARTQSDNYYILIKGFDMFIHKVSGAVIESVKVDKIANQEAVTAVISYPTKDGNQGRIMFTDFWVNDSICEVVCFSKSGQYEELKPTFVSILNSLKLQSVTAYDWASKGSVYQKNKEYDKAIDAFSNATKMDTKNTEYIYQLAYTYSEEGDYNQAIAEMSKAIELIPREAFYYHERAYAYIKSKDAQKALEDENKAIQINPKKATFYAGRGNAYALMEKYEEALTDFQKCAELKGSPFDSTFNLGQTYDMMGNRDEALKYYKLIVDQTDLPAPIKEKVQARINGDWDSYKGWL